jgi:hypothetical protein
MITNPEWLKTEEKPCIHQISQDCISQLSKCLKCFRKGEIDLDTAFKMEEQILTDEMNDSEFLEFAIDNFTELYTYITTGETNIRIHRDITGEIWFYVDKKKHDSRV